MATDLIRYDLLVQDALRSVVRRVLIEAARDGLPGDHHFFISFRTQAPGVRLSQRMRDQYPEEMTIVLQHQFWDLTVGDLGFEVGLSFHGKSETLAIPFSAVTGFFDPSVDFGLKLEYDTEAIELPIAPGAQTMQKPALADQAGAVRLASAEKPKPRGSGTEPLEVEPGTSSSMDQPEQQTIRPANEQPNVISIDAFRKKP